MKDISHYAVELFLALKPEIQEAVADYIEKIATAFEETVPAPDANRQERTQPDIAAKVKELERQNQELAAKVAAMEEEDAIEAAKSRLKSAGSYDLPRRAKK